MSGMAIRSNCKIACCWGMISLAGINAVSAQATGVHSNTTNEPAPALVAQTEVLLKLPSTPLLDFGHWVPAADQLVFVVERVSDDRVMIASRDKSIQGWVLQDQVVRLDQAIDYFTEVLAHDPRNTNAYWLRARLWLHEGDADRAIVNLEEAIRREPDQARFYVTRSLARWKKGQIELAIADCDRAIKFDRHSSQPHLIRAAAWLAQGDAAKCRNDLEAALGLDPVNPIGRLGRVSLLHGNERSVEPPNVRQESGSGSESKPRNAAEFLASGNAHLAKKEYDEAVDDFTEALRLGPANSPAYAGRAEAWARKHYRERELADITEAVKLDPRNTTYRVVKAQSHSAQGRHKEAMAEFNVALGLEPENAAVWVARGNEWRKDLKLDYAIADYTRAIELNPNYTAAYISRGQTWRQRRDFGRAIQEFAELARREPENSLPHMWLARVLATCNDPSSRNGKWAVDEATRACELTNWQDPDCLDTLAAACAENQDFANAIKWQSRAIERLRQNAPSFLLRAMDYGGRRGVGFEDRLAFYKSRKPTRE